MYYYSHFGIAVFAKVSILRLGCNHMFLAGTSVSTSLESIRIINGVSHSCFDFNGFKNIPQLKTLDISKNQIECIINFETITTHT